MRAYKLPGSTPGSASGAIPNLCAHTRDLAHLVERQSARTVGSRFESGNHNHRARYSGLAPLMLFTDEQIEAEANRLIRVG